ncbi:MAG: BatA domain-containing protein, partial [Acidobacteria bacterium]|nr:BatA domain-containing protein [Acidobacteriota bacterium]
MTWASPWAWAFALGVALPLIAHLWSRRQPRTLPFPTLRFLTAASPVSRRLHRVQDWPL